LVQNVFRTRVRPRQSTAHLPVWTDTQGVAKSRIVLTDGLRTARRPSPACGRAWSDFGLTRTHPASLEVACFGRQLPRGSWGNPAYQEAVAHYERVVGSPMMVTVTVFPSGRARALTNPVCQSLFWDRFGETLFGAPTTHTWSACLRATPRVGVQEAPAAWKPNGSAPELRLRRRLPGFTRAERDLRVPAPLDSWLPCSSGAITPAQAGTGASLRGDATALSPERARSAVAHRWPPRVLRHTTIARRTAAPSGYRRAVPPEAGRVAHGFRPERHVSGPVGPECPIAWLEDAKLSISIFGSTLHDLNRAETLFSRSKRLVSVAESNTES